MGVGSLPPGLSLNGFTGDISGTPALGDDTMKYENGSPAGTASFGICVSTTSIQRGLLSQCFGPASIAMSSTTPTTTTTTTTTLTKGASPYCVQSNDGSSNGWNYYKYVDSTSTAPCYAHWNITLGSGCQYYLNGAGPYSTGPGNIWNIVSWGYDDYGAAVAYLNDQQKLEYTCFTNLTSYPQTSLNPTNWS
jgi:hypothetical protein